MADKVKPNYKVLAISGAAMIAPGYAIYQAMRTLRDFPAPAAFATVSMIELSIILLGYQGMRKSEDGDPPTVQFAAAATGVGLGVVAQWWVAYAEGKSLATALVLSVISVLGVVIFHEEIDRVRRVNGRNEKRIGLPRVRVPRELRRHFPELADMITKRAILYPNATQESVFDDAYEEWEGRQKPAVAPERVDIRELRARRRQGQPELPPTPPAPRTKPKTKRAEEPEPTVTVTTLTSVPDLDGDPRVAELLPFARTVAEQWEEENPGKALDREYLTKELRRNGVQGTDVKDLAGALKRAMQATG